MRAEALSRKPCVVGAIAFCRTGDPATGDFGDATVTASSATFRTTSARSEAVASGSAFQVELRAQPVCNRFDHVAPIRVLRPVRHDHDFPGVFVGRDGDGQVRRPFADVFHLQPDGGFEFFARFCWLLQPSITGLRRDPGPPPSTVRAGPCLKSGREPLAIRYCVVLQRRAVVRRVKGAAGQMFQRNIAAVAAGTFLPTCSFSFRLDVFR
jgi:hypothetical protein